MCLTDVQRMLFQSALTLRPLVYFPIDHCQRAYSDRVTATLFLLGSTCCSSVDCVGISLRIRSNLAYSWYQALDAYTLWDYRESITFLARTGFNMKPWRRYLQCGHTHWVFLAIITFT